MKGLFKQYNYYFTDEQYKDIWQNALFVFDTNTLLNLYRYQEETRREFLDVLGMISDRIWLPHHVALEFQRNRLNVICEQKKLFAKTQKAIESTSQHLNKELAPLCLNKRHSSIKVDEFLNNYKNITEKFFSELNIQKSSQQHLSKSDDLKEKLEDLFDRKVGLPPENQTEIDDLYKIAENRYKNKIPPGYLDNEKVEICVDNNLIYNKKFGDFLVWKQILRHCKENQYKQLVFITNDLKEDWWSKYDASGEKFNQPRPELINEALNEAGIQDFIMYDSEKFLSFSSEYLKVRVSDSSVEDVRDNIEIYNKNIKKLNFQRMKENRESSVEILKKSIAFEKVKEFQSKINYLIYRNGGVAEFPTDVLNCPECGLDTMIFNESSSTGYKCTYCENEESDEIEINCTICGTSWPNSEISYIEWSDEGHIEKVCPYCRRDPDYVGDD